MLTRGRLLLRPVPSQQVTEAPSTGPGASAGTWPLTRALCCHRTPPSTLLTRRAGEETPSRGHSGPSNAKPRLEEVRNPLVFGLTLPGS